MVVALGTVPVILGGQRGPDGRGTQRRGRQGTSCTLLCCGVPASVCPIFARARARDHFSENEQPGSRDGFKFSPGNQEAQFSETLGDRKGIVLPPPE